jgi:hypothetical protein
VAAGGGVAVCAKAVTNPVAIVAVAAIPLASHSLLAVIREFHLEGGGGFSGSPGIDFHCGIGLY